MPDVSRSDSQRSDVSHQNRPRVSFNRDVHVKRIVPRPDERIVIGALSGDGTGNFIKSPIRKERLSRSREDLEKEAAKVLREAENVECVISKNKGIPTERYYSLPNRKKKRIIDNESTLERKPKLQPQPQPQNLKSSLRRTKSDVSSRKSRDVPDGVENNKKQKSQLSPIIEINNYGEENKENEFDFASKWNKPAKKPEVFLIDLDKAEQISRPKTAKILGLKIPKCENDKLTSTSSKRTEKVKLEKLSRPNINSNSADSSMMIHSSQLPVSDKPPLTKGRTVDSIVKRLSVSDSSSSPPPRTNILVSPTLSMQHNNNQPFSYTRGISPDKYEKFESDDAARNRNNIIYAQVVCANGAEGTSKQTVHKIYPQKTHQNSDSDEGLGYETQLRKTSSESPKFEYFDENVKNNKFYFGFERGRADGMDSAKRRESLSESENPNAKSDWSARRDLMESRIKNRTLLNQNSLIRLDHEEQFEEQRDDLEYVTTARYSPQKTSQKLHHKSSKNHKIYQSNPEIFHQTNNANSNPDIHRNSYHNSLRRNHSNHDSNGGGAKYFDQSDFLNKYDKFGDSGIENDIPRRKFKTTESEEDEGFASSLLIPSENHSIQRHHHHHPHPLHHKNYEYEAQYEREVYEYPKTKIEYAPRERSIDDGSHYDPRIDKIETKKIEKKPPKPEKKSGLERVKQLFMSSSKKKQREKQAMVKEEVLRSRYKEYRGDHVAERDEGLHSNCDYRNRSRLPTPSPEPSQKNYYTNGHSSDTNAGNWFKSLDRLSRKKSRKNEKDGNLTSTEDEQNPSRKSSKNLRFFGDSLRQREAIRNARIKSQSTRDLHHSTPTEKIQNKERKYNRSMVNIAENERGTSLERPPRSPNFHRSTGGKDHFPRRDERGRRSKNEISSLESSTEGDSSLQSQRSIVYLHAATIGDIPGPGHFRSPVSASREELSNAKFQPRIKTLSRSFSMLAPWKPKNFKESVDIDYSRPPLKNFPSKSASGSSNGGGSKYEQRISRHNNRNNSTSTLKKKAAETRRSNQNLTKGSNSSSLKRMLGGKDENLRNSTSTLYKKKDNSRIAPNSRYKEESGKRMTSKCASVESLGAQSRSSRKSRGSAGDDSREVSRSVSMPRDSNKSAGWFKMGKKTNNNSKSVISQRL